MLLRSSRSTRDAVLQVQTSGKNCRSVGVVARQDDPWADLVGLLWCFLMEGQASVDRYGRRGLERGVVKDGSSLKGSGQSEESWAVRGESWAGKLRKQE